MRGGLERLGANKDALAQMQALAENLKQHKFAQSPSADIHDQSQPMAVETTSKGPRLPLRPRSQQKQQPALGDAKQAGQLPTDPFKPQEGLPRPKFGFPSFASPGQENSLHAWHSSHSMPAAAIDSAPQAAQASSMHNWQPLQESATLLQQQSEAADHADSGPLMPSGQYNALAHPGQLLANMQQSLMSLHRTASDAAENEMQLPLSYTSSSGPAQLGESPLQPMAQQDWPVEVIQLLLQCTACRGLSTPVLFRWSYAMWRNQCQQNYLLQALLPRLSSAPCAQFVGGNLPLGTPGLPAPIAASTQTA